MTSMIRNEYAKMRHLHIAPLTALFFLTVTAMTLFYSVSSGLGGTQTSLDYSGWKILFAGAGMATSLIAPVLIAVIASRQVDIEHTGNGWLSTATAGISPGALCRAKFFSLAGPVAAATIVSCAAIGLGGVLLGASSPIPISRWFAYTAALGIINLSVLALHIVLSARIENQLVCISIGLCGVFVAVFGEMIPTPIAHLIPWGYYSLTKQADYVGEELTYFDLPVFSVIALAAVGFAVFVGVTARFDRQEA